MGNFKQTKMKKIILIATIALLSSCDRITPEEKQRLTTEIHRLDNELLPLRRDVYSMEERRDSLKEEIKFMEDKKKVYDMGKIPVYMLTLHFQEHKMELSLDRISFSFDVPVDEEFYKECKVGEELGHGSRTFKLFHSGDITVKDKKILYR